MSNKVSVQWRAYPMNRLGIKEPKHGVVELSSEKIMIDEVNQRVRQEYPELSSTPILIGKVQKEFKL